MCLTVKRKVFILTLVILGIFQVSCSKTSSRKIAGEYACTVDYYYFDLTPTYIDSSWTENLTVERSKKEIIILGNSIHTDSLTEGEVYTEGTKPSFSIKVSGDSLYYNQTFGGLGGGSSTSRSCLKLN